MYKHNFVPELRSLSGEKGPASSLTNLYFEFKQYRNSCQKLYFDEYSFMLHL